MKIGPVALSLWLALSLAVLANAQADATVEIFIKPCDFQSRQSFVGARLQYWIYSPNGTTVASESVSWNSTDRSQLHWTARVPAGVYRYAVYSNVHPTDHPCMGAGSFAVLPDAVRRIDGGLSGGIGDPIVPLYIFGTAPSQVKVAVVRFDNRPDCGRPLSATHYQSVKIERDSVGYYAQDSSLSGSEMGQNVTFGVRVQQPGQPQRTIRAVASYPSEAIAVPPTSIRIDLTTSLLEAAYKSSTDKLNCVLTGA